MKTIIAFVGAIILVSSCVSMVSCRTVYYDVDGRATTIKHDTAWSKYGFGLRK